MLRPSYPLIATVSTLTVLVCLTLAGVTALQLFELSIDNTVKLSEHKLSRQLATTTDSNTAMGLLPQNLATYLEQEGVVYASLFSPAGEQLGFASAIDALEKPPLPLATLRNGDTPEATARHQHQLIDFQSPQGDSGYMARLLGGNDLTTVTLPASTAPHSDLPSAYLALGLAHQEIWEPLVPALLKVSIISLGTGLLSLVIMLYALNRHTKPLKRLSVIAHDAAEGVLDLDNLPADTNASTKQVAARLNTMLVDLEAYKARIKTDRSVLSKAVELKTAELSRRNRELSQAVEEASLAKERLRRMAYYDSLTALPNRHLFVEQLKLMLRLAHRYEHHLALLFFDLDNFKRINDSLGHNAGDALLREVGHRLSQAVRESDIINRCDRMQNPVEVSRLGGDEFTVVLNQIDSAKAVEDIARRLLRVLSAPMSIEGQELIVTPTIGIALGPQDADNVEGLLKAANTAMHTAKKAGKNGYLFYNRDMATANLERLQLETDLRRAIERDQLRLYFQPQVDLRTGSVIGLEALARWEHPKHGMVSPGQFIPLAEDIGITADIGNWAMQTACHYLAQIDNVNHGHAITVSVNLSAFEFSSKLHKRAQLALNTHGVAPSALVLELTESLLMDTGANTLDTLHHLRDLGVKLSIDDFGTGYSSLSYLSEFPLNELKIDRSFVNNIDAGENNATLVKTIVAMGNSMGLELVAEGVETQDQLVFLAENGVSVIQGYLFSKPLPFEEVNPLLATGYFQTQIDGLLSDSSR
ncbi:MAG: GGDEF domain-containing protein [Gammaproteobacteria bacterium]|nr:MAG: GGDEF domain-containing protein [Gammaproteobacteria bacterium]